MAQQVRFNLVTTQQVIGALKATNSTDADVLAAAKEEIAVQYRPLRWFGIWGLITGGLCTVMIIFAFIGIPLLGFGYWALKRSKNNRQIIDTAYDEYVAKVVGTPSSAGTYGDLRAIVMLVVVLVGSSTGAFAQVPASVHGTWVQVAAACTATLRFQVEAAKVTLVNGSDSQSFGGIQMAGPSYFGPDYTGIQAVLITEFEADQPIRAYFNHDEKKDIAQLEFTVLQGKVHAVYAAQQARLQKLALGKRFPLENRPLKRCS